MVWHHVIGGHVEGGIKESGIIGLLLKIWKGAQTERGRKERGQKEFYLNPKRGMHNP
jgi:hypothetical protein